MSTTFFAADARERARAPLHVLMTADALGGVWTYTMTLLAALRPSGMTFTLAVMGPAPSASQRAQAEAMPHVRLRTHPYKLEWMPDCDHDLHHAGRWLQRLAKRIAPDVIHVNGYAHAALPFDRPVVSVAHSCLRSWWRAVKGGSAPNAWDAYTERVHAGLDASARIVAPTHAMAEALQHEYLCDKPIDVIANGLPPAPYPFQLASHGSKESCIFASGRCWDDAKNLDALDDIAATLSWPVMVAGSLGDHPVPRHVWHLGAIDRADVQHRLARAAIYVYPARYEPFGLGVLEAAQAGCALVLGDIPSLREVWGDAALYVHPDDRVGLRKTLAEVIANRPLRMHLATAARARACGLTDRRMAEQYLALYQGLAAERTAFAAPLAAQVQTPGSEVAACGL